MEHLDTLGPMLGCCAHRMKERMDARMAGCDSTPTQAHVLLYLHHHGGQATQCAVTEHLKVKPSTVNGILDRMEEKELVTRTVSATDARQRLITLTEKGKEQQEQLKRAFLETENAAVRGFNPQEKAELLGLLSRVMQNLEEDRTLC